MHTFLHIIYNPHTGVITSTLYSTIYTRIHCQRDDYTMSTSLSKTKQRKQTKNKNNQYLHCSQICNPWQIQKCVLMQCDKLTLKNAPSTLSFIEKIMQTFSHVHVCRPTSVLSRTCAPMHTFICKHTCANSPTRTQAHAHRHMHAHTHTHTHTHTHIHMHTHTHTHTHTHKAQTSSLPPQPWPPPPQLPPRQIYPRWLMSIHQKQHTCLGKLAK